MLILEIADWNPMRFSLPHLTIKLCFRSLFLCHQQSLVELEGVYLGAGVCVFGWQTFSQWGCEICPSNQCPLSWGWKSSSRLWSHFPITFLYVQLFELESAVNPLPSFSDLHWAFWTFSKNCVLVNQMSAYNIVFLMLAQRSYQL